MESATKTPSQKDEAKDLELQVQASGPTNTAVTFDPAVVKSLKRKADFILLPILTVAYLFKYEPQLSRPSFFAN